MSFACHSDRRCDHPLSDCATVTGEYCLICHHTSTLPTPVRRSTPLGARPERPGSARAS